MSRTKRNQDIYNSTDISDISKLRTDNNVSVISDAEKNIDIDKIRNYLNSEYEEDNKDEKRVSLELPPEEEKEVTRHTIKDYDINAVLERARDNRDNSYEENKYRKINNTKAEIDILKNIKIKEEKADNSDLTGPIDELNTEEKTIVDLIKDIQNNSNKKKELFDDLMSDNEDTVVFGMKDDEDNLKEALLDITRELNDTILPDTEFTREMNAEKEVILNKINDSDDEEEVEDEEDDTVENDLKELEKIEKTLNMDILDNDEDTTEFVEIPEDVDNTSTSPKISTIDKSFYTNSMTFNKSDFEGFEDLEKSASSSIFSKIAIVLIILMLIATVVLILNFVFDWNII